MPKSVPCFRPWALTRFPVLVARRPSPEQCAGLNPRFRPGEMVLEEFLEPFGLEQTEAATQMSIPANGLKEIVLGKCRITVPDARRLFRSLKTSPQFWTPLHSRPESARTRSAQLRTNRASSTAPKYRRCRTFDLPVSQYFDETTARSQRDGGCCRREARRSGRG